MKKIMWLAAFLALLIGISGCTNNLSGDDGGSGTVAVSGITITSATGSGTIVNGATLQLTAVITPDNATNKEVTWSSSDAAETYLAVDQNGLVTAKAVTTDNVTITATAKDGSGVQGTFDLSVKENAGSGGLSFTTLSLATVAYGSSGEGGESVVAKTPGTVGLWYDAANWVGATVVPGNVTAAVNSLSFDYTVSSGSSAYGIQLFDTVSTNGTYLVTYTVTSGISQDVVCNGYTYALTAGTAQNVSALMTVSGASSTSGGTVISIQIPVDSTDSTGCSFSISNAKYAAVSDSDFTLSALAVSSSTAAIVAGNTKSLTLTGAYSITDSDSVVYTVYKTVAVTDASWSSDKESVATVSDGTIQAVAEGSAVITATVDGKSATCTVTVSPKATVSNLSVSLDTRNLVQDSRILDCIDTNSWGGGCSTNPAVTTYSNVKAIEYTLADSYSWAGAFWQSNSDTNSNYVDLSNYSKMVVKFNDDACTNSSGDTVDCTTAILKLVSIGGGTGAIQIAGNADVTISGPDSDGYKTISIGLSKFTDVDLSQVYCVGFCNWENNGIVHGKMYIADVHFE